MSNRKRSQSTEPAPDAAIDLRIIAGDTLGELVGEVIESQPSPASNIAELIAEENNQGNTTDNNSVSSSSLFDPAIHSVDSAGNPRLNKDGSYRKKRGPKSGATSQVQVTAVTEDQKLEAKTAAILTVQCLFIICTSLGGEEWQPIKDSSKGTDERKQLIEVWEQYYISSGVFNIPPWMTVVVATGMYAAPRFTMPKTQSRARKVWTWMKMKLGW